MQQLKFYGLIALSVLGCIALVVVPKLCAQSEQPSPHETFVDLYLENSPLVGISYITVSGLSGSEQVINVWSYHPQKQCSSDHIIGIVNYQIYANGRAEFLNDFNMHHLTRGHKADPDLLALADQVRELRCTHPCLSDTEIDAWYEGYPTPELRPCILEYKDGTLVAGLIK